MAKFHGAVGFVSTQETAPGVWREVSQERNYYGDVTRMTNAMREANKVNADLTISNTVSIVADGFLSENFHSIRYVIWHGVKWQVSNCEIVLPRIVLYLGGLYREE